MVLFLKRPVGNENSLMGLKSGRRRWGQTKRSDSWDESDPSDTAASNSKKPSMRAEENKPTNEFTFESVNIQLDCAMLWLWLTEYFIKMEFCSSKYMLFLLFLMTNLFRPKDQKLIYTNSNVTKLPSSIKSSSSLQSTCSARQHYLRQSRYLPGMSAIWVCPVQLRIKCHLILVEEVAGWCSR